MNVFSRSYIDSLYEDYQLEPESLPIEWQQYFQKYDPASDSFDADQLPTQRNPSASVTSFSASATADLSHAVGSNGAGSANGAVDQQVTCGINELGDAECDEAIANMTVKEVRKVVQLQDRVDQLIRGYRVRGHLEANIDPLGTPRKANSELNLESYGLSREDFQIKFSARTVNGCLLYTSPSPRD